MRPYFHFSIVQLESEFDRARGAADIFALMRLSDELDKRRETPRVANLRKAILQEVTPEPTDRRQPPCPAAGRTLDAQTQPRPDADRAFNTQTRPRPSERRPAHDYRVTDEQTQALSLFNTGGSLKINAYAGTGKTSTLQLLANSTQRRGQYIAFNKAIVSDATDKFPETVNCATTHALAYRHVAPRFPGNPQKLTGRINPNALAEILQFQPWQIDKSHKLMPRSQGWLVLETVKRFAQSADAQPAIAHVPLHGSLVTASPGAVSEVQNFAVKWAVNVWQRMQRADNPLPLGHDGYLKLWALSNPMISADYIMLDEAQDTNPVVLGVLKNQTAQMIYVGDKYQQIYEWRGAVNAMETIATANEARLTRSFRFGPTLAAAASSVLLLLGEKVAIEGNPEIVTAIASNSVGKTILARTNASTISAVISALDSDKRPYLAGGNGDLMRMLQGVQELKEGRPANDVPDFFGFNAWQEVVEFANSGEGGHLQTFVNLVTARGERQLMWALKRTVAEENAVVIISTAHKSKGQQWPSVDLLDDFLRSRDGTPQKKADLDLQAGELRLFYVAITRARQMLSVPSTYHRLLGL